MLWLRGKLTTNDVIRINALVKKYTKILQRTETNGRLKHMSEIHYIIKVTLEELSRKYKAIGQGTNQSVKHLATRQIESVKILTNRQILRCEAIAEESF